MTFLLRTMIPGLPDFYTHRALPDPAPRRARGDDESPVLEGEMLLGCILDRLAIGERMAQTLSDETGASYSAVDYWLRIAMKRGQVERVAVRVPLSRKPLFRYRLAQDDTR